MSDGLPQSLFSLGSTSRRDLFARATRCLAGLSGGLFIAIGLEEALARNASTKGALGGRHGKNRRGRKHKRHHKHHKHKGPGGGAGCRNDSQCKQGEKCCNGNCIDPQTNANHCGGCGKKCSSGFCRSAQCVDCTVCSTCTHKSIQPAIDASSDHGTVWVCAGTYNERIQVNKQNLKLNGLVAGSDSVVINGGGLASPTPVLNVTAGESEIRDLTVTGGKASAETGGGVVNSATNTLFLRVVITGNDAGNFSGGGLSNTGSAVKLDSCTITGNTAALGGGLSNDLPTAWLVLKNTIVEKNTATERGGGVYNEGRFDFCEGSLSYVRNNESRGSAGSGGGIFNISGTGQVNNRTGQPTTSLIKDNKPDQCRNSDGSSCSG